jgi:integrase
MSIASAKAYIDKAHPKKDGKCSVYIRVISRRKHKSYKTGISLSAKEFDRAMTAKRRTTQETKHQRKIQSFEKKANDVIETLPFFTFPKFEELYLSNRDVVNNIASAFEQYITELREQERIGTAESYEVAKNSIEKFKAGLKFADITPRLLTNYENWMLKQGRSKSTIGIYLRSLRALFNRANIDRSIYPFGEGKGKYSIPTSRNIKKALTLEEIAKLFYYKAKKGTPEQMAKDYWIFIYLCNGLNVKDLCLLKQKNIDGDILRYERSKTIRSKKQSEEIIISLKPEAKAIIKRWGVKNIYPEAYVFPHLEKEMTAVRQRDIVKQVTANINKYIKRIAKEVGIKKPVTTYYARHSFATILRNSGATTEFISEALGHSDLKTTKSYLAGFETDKIHQTTDALTAFAK